LLKENRLMVNLKRMILIEKHLEVEFLIGSRKMRKVK